MDELERLVYVYRMRVSSPVASKLDVLMDFERIPDSRIVTSSSSASLRGAISASIAEKRSSIAPSP